ncbi:MAG: hypothetical protein Q9210_001227 [Variospora velana]
MALICMPEKGSTSQLSTWKAQHQPWDQIEGVDDPKATTYAYQIPDQSARSSLTVPQVLPGQEGSLRVPRAEGNSRDEDSGHLGQNHSATRYVLGLPSPHMKQTH